VGFLVSLPNCLFQLSTTMSLINNISEWGDSEIYTLSM
jgi:hypothetical protein